MTSDTIQSEKLLLAITTEDGTIELEAVWVTQSDHGYRIDSIPFYAREIAWGDVVEGQRDPDGMLRFVSLLAPSGHSTLRLWFAAEQDVQAVREELRARDCTSELDLARLLAVDIPPNVPYAEIQAYLDNKEKNGILEYEEGCLGQR